MQNNHPPNTRLFLHTLALVGAILLPACDEAADRDAEEIAEEIAARESGERRDPAALTVVENEGSEEQIGEVTVVKRTLSLVDEEKLEDAVDAGLDDLTAPVDEMASTCNTTQSGCGTGVFTEAWSPNGWYGRTAYCETQGGFGGVRAYAQSCNNGSGSGWCSACWW